MSTEHRKLVRFYLGVLSVLAGIWGTFYGLPSLHIALLYFGGVGLTGERSQIERLLKIFLHFLTQAFQVRTKYPSDLKKPNGKSRDKKGKKLADWPLAA